MFAGIRAKPPTPTVYAFGGKRLGSRRVALQKNWRIQRSAILLRIGWRLQRPWYPLRQVF